MSSKQDYRLSEEIRNFIIKKKIRPTVIRSNLLETFNRSISYSTIRHTWERYLATGSIKYQQPAGRPKALSEREERHLVRDFIFHPGKSIKSTVKLQAQQPIANRSVDKRTIRRTLRRRRLCPRTSQRGKEIIPKNREERLLFAQRHANWTLRDWSTIVFSDEATLFPHMTRTRVLWNYNQAQRVPPFEESLKNKSVNVWGYLRYDGEIEIFRFEGAMRQEDYVEMIEDRIFNAIAPPRHGAARLTFMQDNATYHTAKSVNNWFRRNRVNPLTWPSQSPNLSPIENIWAAVKNELWVQRARIKTPNDTFALSREIVHNLQLTYIHSLYESMPKRMEDVINNNGNRIAY